MRYNTLSTLLAAASVPAVMAHYNFEALIVNGEATSPYEYVRQTTNSNSPIEDVTSPNIVCNQGGLDADIMAKTKTMEVSPGDSVGFTVNSELGHPGPQAVYLSRAPDGTSAAEYKGDGDWFKVYELSTSSITDEGLQWATFPNNAGIKNFTFTLPEQLPAGEYLMRAEHVALHAAGSVGGAQFYIGCAQLNVGGSGTGSPSPTVKFPGAYDGQEPGLLINIYYPAPTSYTAPGPATWPNACEDHTANLAGQTSDGDCTGSDGDAGSGNGGGSNPAPAPSASASSSASVRPTATPSSGVTRPGNGTVPATTVREPVTLPTAGSGSGSGSGSDDCTQRKARRAARRAIRRAAPSFRPIVG